MTAAVVSAVLSAVASAAGVVSAGHRRIQLGCLGLAGGSGGLGILLLSAPGQPGSPAAIALLASLGLLAFSAWNLWRRPGERWAFRVVIYGFYAAGFAAAGAMLAAHRAPPAGLSRAEWIFCAASYGLSSALIASTKPWFARKMLH